MTATAERAEHVDRLVSADTLAEILGVDAYLVRRWATEARLPHYRVTRGILRFDLDEVLALWRREGASFAASKPQQ